MAASSTAGGLVITVRRKTPELVAPAKPTPREFKLLSDIDDQDCLRFQIPSIKFYRNDGSSSSMEGRERDPVKVIREAIAKTLVWYYPFAGRLKELGPGRKLAVDCTGEGVMFIEADADVTMDHFGDQPQPPFPCLDQLLYDVPGSGGILDCPLLLIQVTRLRCGSFIVAIRANHTMCDALGQLQFMKAVGEIARGASSISVQPVWQRDLLSAREPPHVTCAHREYSELPDTKGAIIPRHRDVVVRSFFFGPKEVSALRKLVPSHLQDKCSTFEVVTACLWRCRTVALQPNLDEEVRVLCSVNARGKYFNPPLPVGYYGNAFAMPAAVSTAGGLCRNPLGYALELVMKAKADVTEEYMRSLADFLVTKGRPHVAMVRSYLVSDVTRFRDVDFGWGKAAYGGPAKVKIGWVSFYVPFTNKKDERGILVPVCLPGPAMDKFVVQFDSMLTAYQHTNITSAL